jgi:hypothetical protein
VVRRRRKQSAVPDDHGSAAPCVTRLRATHTPPRPPGRGCRTRSP